MEIKFCFYELKIEEAKTEARSSLEMADLVLVLKKEWRKKRMPATQFICPNGDKVNIDDCLKKCKQGKRCMFLPTLRAIAKSVDRKVKQPSVTELISGVRETYLKKATEYAVDPFSILYSLQGQAVHSIHEKNAEGILSEIRMEDGITSGKFDLYGNLLDEEEGILGDLKITNSYKLMRALGFIKLMSKPAKFIRQE